MRREITGLVGTTPPHRDDASSGLWGLDESVFTLLVVGGAVLFFFSEPATSALGILLMGTGPVAWLVDWAT